MAASERLVLREARNEAVRQWLREGACQALLLRPDRHIAATAAQAADIPAMLRRYVGGEGLA